MNRRLAAVDVGTNTVRLLAVEVQDEELHILDEYGEVTGLGAGLIATGGIAPADAERTLACLRSCVERTRRLAISNLAIVGTEVFRRAANGAEVAAEFSRDIGHLVRIIGGDEEAEASYLGAIGWGADTGPGPNLVFDVGGGSSEVIFGDGAALVRTLSHPVGALTLTAEFLSADPPGAAAVLAARQRLSTLADSLVPIEVELRRAARGPGGTGGHGEVQVLAVGGSACAVAAWVHRIVPYAAANVQGSLVERAPLRAAISEWTDMSVARRVAEGRMSEGRAQVLLGGALILETLLERLDRPGFQASTFGLRHGLILRQLLAY